MEGDPGQRPYWSTFAAVTQAFVMVVSSSHTGVSDAIPLPDGDVNGAHNTQGKLFLDQTDMLSLYYDADSCQYWLHNRWTQETVAIMAPPANQDTPCACMWRGGRRHTANEWEWLLEGGGAREGGQVAERVGASWAVLGCLWAVLSCLASLFGLSWAILGPAWEPRGSSWVSFGRPGPSWDPPGLTLGCLGAVSPPPATP